MPPQAQINLLRMLFHRDWNTEEGRMDHLVVMLLAHNSPDSKQYGFCFQSLCYVCVLRRWVHECFGHSLCAKCWQDVTGIGYRKDLAGKAHLAHLLKACEVPLRSCPVLSSSAHWAHACVCDCARVFAQP